jgi:hypothetical protein
MKDRCGSHTAQDWTTPWKQDADFEISVAKAADRRNISRKVLNSVAAFTASNDLSFRKAAGNATFEFVSDLVDLGISIEHEISLIAGAAYVLDHFSALSVQEKTA